MTTFSKTGFKTLNYNSFRPHYPARFYELLQEYAVKRTGDRSDNNIALDKALDVGCGSGVATYPLLNFTKQVIGLDLSPSMVETANGLKHERLAQLDVDDASRIQFLVASAEQLAETDGTKEDSLPGSEQLTDGTKEELGAVAGRGTFDLITAAQCIHWFQDHRLFFEKTGDLLKPHTGVLAYWYYVDPNITEYSGSEAHDEATKARVLAKAHRIYHKYVYDDPQFMGKYWEQPGRTILQNEEDQVTQQIPTDLYTDVRVQKFRAGDNDDFTAQPTEHDLHLVKQDVTLRDMVDYIGTYSGYHNYQQATGDPQNLLESYVRELETELGWNRASTRITITWNTGYVFMRRR